LLLNLILFIFSSFLIVSLRGPAGCVAIAFPRDCFVAALLAMTREEGSSQ
jgi:hypothetical protein